MHGPKEKTLESASGNYRVLAQRLAQNLSLQLSGEVIAGSPPPIHRRAKQAFVKSGYFIAYLNNLSGC